MATLRYKKRGNKWYVYELYQYWDKELKKPRQKSIYLGVADVLNGSYSKPGRRVSAPALEKEILDCGDSHALLCLARSMELDKVIAGSFDNFDSIMALICFQITEGTAMYNCGDWMDGNIAKKLFPSAQTSSQDISRLIKHLGRQEIQATFFKAYVSKFFSGKRGLLMDSTALPSAINSSINAFGYSAGNIEQNVSCLMLVDKESHLPIYFRAIGGDIADVSTVKTTVVEIKKLGLIAESAILDAGFCSKENIQFLGAEEIDFVTRLPKSHKVFGEFVSGAGQIEETANVVHYGDRIVFVKTKKATLYGVELYVHVIFDPAKKSKDVKGIFRDQIIDKLSESDTKSLNKKMQTAGFFILLSRSNIDKKEILPSYYARQAIEQVFGFAKSNNNILPLRVHDEQSIRGSLMLVFLALIIFITMRRRLTGPVDKALLTLRALKAKVFDQDIIVQEPSKKINDVLKQLGVIMPIKLGV